MTLISSWHDIYSFIMVHDIYKLLDDGLEIKGIFVDISSAFDKVWHEGLLLKLNRNGMPGNLLKLLSVFFCCRKQRVVLNGQHSHWKSVNAGVVQSSILGQRTVWVCLIILWSLGLKS